MADHTPALPRSPHADRTILARIGLTLIAVCLFLGNSPPVGLLPAALALLLPKFRIIGWWITVVLTLLLTSVATGGLIFLARNWSVSAFEAPGLAWWSLGLMTLMLLGGLITLVGLLAPGTRYVVEQRTRELAPYAFDEDRP